MFSHIRTLNVSHKLKVKVVMDYYDGPKFMVTLNHVNATLPVPLH